MSLERRLAELSASRLWVAYHDYAGLARAKAVAQDRLTDGLGDGIGWAKANWDLAITDHQVPDPGFAADSGDFRLVPDPAALRPLPHHPGVALAYGWMTEPDGTPWIGDPRARLAAAAASLEGQGVAVAVGMEAEFALYRSVDVAGCRMTRT
jgi:glutamine synthetase